MTGIDTNILVDLMVSSSDHHSQARQGMANLNDHFCTTPTNIGECLRLLTHSKVFKRPLNIKNVCLHLKSLLEFYRIQILEEPTNWWEDLSELHKSIPDLRGNEVFDARIALCLRSHNVKRIYTRDSDFRKYDFLQVIRPL